MGTEVDKKRGMWAGWLNGRGGERGSVGMDERDDGAALEGIGLKKSLFWGAPRIAVK